MPKRSKALLGMGTCDKFHYCERAVMKGILSQTYKNYDVLLVDNSESHHYASYLQINYPEVSVTHINRAKYYRDALGQVRKTIVDYAVSHGYEYLFFVDADFIIKPHTLQKLMSHNVDFVTAVIGYMHHHKNKTTCFIENPDPSVRSKIPGLPGVKALKYHEMDSLPELYEITACGLSCCLIKTKFLPGISFYISHQNQSFLEDVIFIRDIRRKGARIFLDTKLRPMHFHLQFPERQFRAQS